MRNTEDIIKEAYQYIAYQDDVARAIFLAAEQLRIANLLKAKELGMQIPESLILTALVSENDANSIMKSNEEMRLNLGNNR